MWSHIILISDKNYFKKSLTSLQAMEDVLHTSDQKMRSGNNGKCKVVSPLN
jgi:hypothetical protein